MQISSIDHLVLTVSDISVTCEFYKNVLGMETTQFGDNRHALKFGQQKINLHEYGKELKPRANLPTVGLADLCLISPTSINEIILHLQQYGVDIIEGSVQRTGATGLIISVYLRDPDLNLIEICHYLN